MSIFVQYDSKKIPKCKVELHVHLDGAVRWATIWELAERKKIELPAKSLEELIEKGHISHPVTLAEFLKPFHIISDVLRNDLDAVQRIAYEFCEDIAKQNVAYAEVRYSPHLFLKPNAHGDALSPADVVKQVNLGLKQGQADFKVKVRSILCCIRGHSEWSKDVLDLCKAFSADGVVGIDIAGDEAKEMAAEQDIAIFQEAARLGIHRTAHAGEAGPAANVAFAKNKLMCERIGHGYHVLESDAIYKECLDANIHFEVCPYSSYLTKSVPLSSPKHPIIKFAEDDANFSISRDDPALIQKTLEQERSLLLQLGCISAHIARADMNAARSCFLPEEEKKELLKDLQVLYGLSHSKM